MKTNGSHDKGRLLATVTLGAMLWLDLGCAPKPVVPSGWRRVTINSEEAIANYHEHVARTLEERRGRSLWQRQLELLTHQVSELRGVVTYLQLKQQDGDRMRTGPDHERTERISSHTLRPSRAARQEPPIHEDASVGEPARSGSDLESRRAQPSRSPEPCGGQSRHSEEGYARLWNDAFQRLSGISPHETCGDRGKAGSKLVRVKPLSGPLIPHEAAEPRSRTEAHELLDEGRPPLVTSLNARERLEVRNHAVIFRARPDPGVTTFTPSRQSHAYLKKAAAQNPIVVIRSYSDGAEGDDLVQDVTRTRAEVVRSYLVALGVPAMNIDLQVYPGVMPDATGQEVPVKHRHVEIEFLVQDPAQVYPLWNARRG
jgi:hypothetical protein